MREDFDKIVRRVMAEKGIKTVKELADKINNEAGCKVITANSIGKWLRTSDKRKAIPKATSLMFLCKALNINADLLLYNEGENPEQFKSLEKMVSNLVKVEIQKASKILRNHVDEKFCRFMRSEKVPKALKDNIIKQIEDFLKLFEDQ